MELRTARLDNCQSLGNLLHDDWAEKSGISGRSLARRRVSVGCPLSTTNLAAPLRRTAETHVPAICGATDPRANVQILPVDQFWGRIQSAISALSFGPSTSICRALPKGTGPVRRSYPGISPLSSMHLAQPVLTTTTDAGNDAVARLEQSAIAACGIVSAGNTKGADAPGRLILWGS